MRLQPCQRHVVTPQQVRDYSIQRLQLRGRWRLPVKVAQSHDADVALVVILDVRPLPCQRTSFPHAAFTIDCEVIADVAPALVAMRAANGFQSGGCASRISAVKRVHSVMMHGDVLHRQHAIHQ